MTVRRFLPAAFIAVAVLSAAPAFAEPSEAAAEASRPGQIARERIDELMRGLEKLVAELPRYGLPEIAENGDIVIPRKNPPLRGPTDSAPAPDGQVDL